MQMWERQAQANIEDERGAREEIARRLRHAATEAAMLSAKLGKHVETIEVEAAQTPQELAAALDDISAFINAIRYGALVTASTRHATALGRLGV